MTIDLPTHLLPPGGTPLLPIGLRASSWAQCVSRCFIESIDPGRYFAFDPGVGQAGHDLADLFIERVLEPTGTGVSEHVIPWTHGTSHMDRLQLTGPHAGGWELKTTNKNPLWEPITPSADNRKQVRLMTYLCERAGITIPGPFRIALIAKKDWSLHGPWTVDYDPATDGVALAAELALLDSWMARVSTIDLDEDPELREHCTCSDCFKVVRTWMEDVSDIVDVGYRALVNEPRPLSEWSAVEKDLKPMKAEVKRLMQAAGETHAETWFYFATLSKSGALTIKPRPVDAVAVGNAAA